MDCPNCDQRPVGSFYTFRLNGVSFKQKFKGYFRCRHCNTLLKQKQNSSFLPVYEKKFWIYYGVLFAAIVALAIGYSLFTHAYDLGEGIFLGGFVVIMIGMLAGIDELKARYWVLRKADFEEDDQTAKKLSKTGLLIFLGYAVVAVYGVIELVRWLPKLGIFQGQQISMFLLMAAQLICLGVVFGGAVWILKKFSYKQENAPT